MTGALRVAADHAARWHPALPPSPRRAPSRHGADRAPRGTGSAWRAAAGTHGAPASCRRARPAHRRVRGPRGPGVARGRDGSRGIRVAGAPRPPRGAPRRWRPLARSRARSSNRCGAPRPAGGEPKHERLVVGLDHEVTFVVSGRQGRDADVVPAPPGHGADRRFEPSVAARGVHPLDGTRRCRSRSTRSMKGGPTSPVPVSVIDRGHRSRLHSFEQFPHHRLSRPAPTGQHRHDARYGGRKEGIARGNRNREVVQLREGLRLHHP